MSQIFLIFIGIVVFVGFIGFSLAAAGNARETERKDAFKKSFAHVQNFNPFHIHIDKDGGSNIAIDSDAKKFALGRHGTGSKVYKYSDLISVDVRRNGSSLQKTNRGSQMAGAAVGAVLLGPVGAIIGGLSGSQRLEQKTTELSIRLTVNNESNHSQELIFFRSSVGMDSNHEFIQTLSRKMDDWHGRLQLVMKNG